MKIAAGEPVALMIMPAMNTPTAGPSCAPDCMNALNRPRRWFIGTALATADALAGI